MSGNLWMFSDMLDDEDIEMQKHDFITLASCKIAHRTVSVRWAF